MKKTKKFIASLALVAMVATMAPMNAFAATGVTTDRLSGADRFGTAIAVAEKFVSATTAVLAPAADANLVDALAAAPLAGKTSPILLSDNDSLTEATKNELIKLKVTKVYVVGALKQAVVDQVNAIPGVTAVVLKGDDRIATAAKINEQLVSPVGTFVVGYYALADALSVASFAAANNYAIVVANVNGTLPMASSIVGSKTYLVGGPTLVSDIAGATRLAGADRFATNKVVLDTLGYSYNNVYVANGTQAHLVDSLSASSLAAKSGAPIVLTDTENGGDAALASVGMKLAANAVVTALGGTTVVSDASVAKVVGSVPATPSVSSVSAINLNQIKVMFNVVVDKDTAENEANYLVGGSALVSGTDIAVLQADKQTVLITLNAPQAQYAKTWVTVNKAILTADLLQTAPKIEQEVVFTDTTVPTVASVTASGNTKVTVKFSEPLKLLAAGADASNFKINDQSVVNYGYISAALKNATLGNYADGIELTFGTTLPVGANTLTVPAGSGASLVDAAGFMVTKTTMNFNVDTVTNAPKVTGITGMNNGTVYVTFDRAMKDSAATDGALNLSNYDIGDGATNPTAASFKSGTSNTVVKLTFASGKVVLGGNILVLDKDMVDTYGNEIDGTNDVRVSYVATEDTVKPTVTTVTLTSSTVIRVKFSETVNYLYAQNLANFKLKDSAGTNISARMTGIVAKPTVNTNSDTFDITLTPGLEGSNYSLTIKNVVDTAYTPNAMNEFTTTISGSDTTGPVFSVAVASTGSVYKVVAYFNEAMDISTISNVANYAFTNGLAEVKALPAGTTLNMGEGNKSAEIVFPTNYTTAAGATALNIVAIRVANVKDVAGNILTAISTTNAVQTAAASAAYGPTLVANSFKLYNTGSNLTAEVEFDQALSTLVLADFVVGGVTADSGYLTGKKVILTFTGAKVTTIKAFGIANTITAAAPASTNVAGVLVKAIAATTVYSNTLAPKLISAPVVASDGANTVTLTFDSPVDSTIAGLYADDFTFMNNTQGKVISAVSNNAAGNVLTYTFAAADVALADSITVKAVPAKISVKTLEDPNGVQTLYVPSTTDTNGYTVVTGA